jgi:hypothetical protein
MRLPTVFITLGLVFLLTGMCFGVWIGVNEQFQLGGAHAHWNLLGFVTSVLYGLIHTTHPELASSRLAWPQCIAHFVGAAIFGPAIALVITTEEARPVMIGSALVLLAALMFLVMYVMHSVRAREPAPLPAQSLQITR